MSRSRAATFILLIILTDARRTPSSGWSKKVLSTYNQLRFFAINTRVYLFIF